MPTNLKSTATGKAKKPKARAWNAGGFHVFFGDGSAEYVGVRSVEDAIALYPEPARRKIMAVVLSDAFPSGSIPVETDLAFVVIRARVEKRQTPIPRHEISI